MRQVIAAMLMCAVLLGCSNKPVVEQRPRIVHPELPVAVSTYAFSWKVVVIDEENVIVGLGYDDSLDFKIFLEDIKRYINESNSVMCSYRRELNEPRCMNLKYNK